MTIKQNPALAALRHHVTGAIERGEGVAIVEQRAAAMTHNAKPATPQYHDLYGTRTLEEIANYAACDPANVKLADELYRKSLGEAQ